MRLRGKMIALGALGAAVALFTSTMNPGVAQAHGGFTYPKTRTYACYVNGLEGGQGGDLAPTNPACAEAIERGGKTALWNWFGNLISDVGDNHRERIPDGKLCGPTETFDAYNMARTDWPTTTMPAGETVTLRYNAWAAHPGTWYQYVTKDSWDPSEPLAWSDLEPEPFNTVTNPPINGSGPHGDEYTWQAELPDKNGRHLIYSIWQRSDSPEAFYNCSDVIFE
ncbi:chitin-binding protein [Actinopolyspora lacussalsi]|nr:chitin-binding protein [Actinopolyspora lacussalsi]